MNKKILFPLIGVSALSISLVAAVLTSKSMSKMGKIVFAEDPTYTLTLNASTLSSASGSGSVEVDTINGNKVQFDYTGLTIADGNLVFESGATLLNPRLVDGNNNYISGIKQIVATYQGEATGAFKVDYTWGDSLLDATPYYQRRGFVFSSTYTTYSFLGERPNFLKFTASAASTVESIQIKYSCNRSEEAGDNLVINTPTILKQFRTVVNMGNNFSGQTVELGTDLDLSELDGNLGGSIGHTDDTPFSGIFDGKNHTISNFEYSGNDSVGLFSRVTNGTIKNLKVSNVKVSYSGSQRGAGVVARAENTTLDNVHVLSGSIGTSANKVKTQNGGIIGIAVGTVEIKNSSNAAAVYASSQYNGGILGFANGAAKVTITNCVNSGDITGAGNGTGGILGASPTGSTDIIKIAGCINEGNITGAAYVGGIGGIMRESSASSYIRNCTNKANVVGTGVGVGGITGISRFETTDCMCLHSVTVKTSVANTLNAIGTTVAGTGGAGSTPGYITGTAGNGATVTGKLINADGSDYVA